MTALATHSHRYWPPAKSGAPTLLLLHGTGGDENDLVPLAQRVMPQAGLLGIRGNVLEQGASRFFRRLSEGVFDMDDLHRRTRELADFVRSAIVEYGLDPSAIYALGFSNGANIAASLLLSEPNVLAAAILLRAMFPFQPTVTPDLTGKKILLSAGRVDGMVPASSVQALGTLLVESGAEVTLSWNDAGHGLVESDLAAIGTFLATLQLEANR